MSRKRPEGQHEHDARRLWRKSHPYKAMKVLHDNGYNQDRRMAFLRDVIGLPQEDVVIYGLWTPTD